MVEKPDNPPKAAAAHRKRLAVALAAAMLLCVAGLVLDSAPICALAAAALAAHSIAPTKRRPAEDAGEVHRAAAPEADENADNGADEDEGVLVDEAEELMRAELEAKERIVTVDRMLSHSDNIFATAQDLMESETEDEVFAALVWMLKRCPPVQRQDAPAVKPIKLARTKRYWLACPEADESEQVYDDLVQLESVFNINRDLQMLMAKTADDGPDFKNRAHRVLQDFALAPIDYESDNDYLGVAYPDVDPGDVVGEWALRNAIASAVENAHAPFRLDFNMRTNAMRGLVLIYLEIPRPSCFAYLADDEREQNAIAADYAFRSAFFMARVALGASPQASPVVRAVVCCHYRNAREIRLSLDASPATVTGLRALAATKPPFDPPQDFAALRILVADDALQPVAPHIAADDALLNPDRYQMAVETSDKRCYPRLALASGARFERDLGFREGVLKEEAWRQIGDLGSSAESAVARLSALRESNADPGVRAACERCMRALAEGSVEPDQTETLQSTFMGNSDLVKAVARCMDAYGMQSPIETSSALEELQRALTPQLQISMMDDTESVFRYFQSSTERLFYNLHAGDGRQVKLVPQVYYSANELAAHLLCQLDRPDEAAVYAEEAMRLAPLSASAAVTMARVLEFQSKIFEAVKLMNGATDRAVTVHDAALCYYRMAYLQWRLGNNRLSYACYRVSVGLRTEISGQAGREMQELMASDDSLTELTASEACRILEQNGLHVWNADDHRNELARAAVLCTDQLLYPCAAQLTMSLLEYKQDDAIACIFKSLVDF